MSFLKFVLKLNTEKPRTVTCGEVLLISMEKKFTNPRKSKIAASKRFCWFCSKCKLKYFSFTDSFLRRDKLKQLLVDCWEHTFRKATRANQVSLMMRVFEMLDNDKSINSPDNEKGQTIVAVTISNFIVQLLVTAKLLKGHISANVMKRPL